MLFLMSLVGIHSANWKSHFIVYLNIFIRMLSFSHEIY